MARTTLNQRSFALGELKPSLLGRTDVPKYLTALKKARNVMFDKTGILMNHAGSETILPGKFPTKSTRLIPFKFSFNQQYEMVFGDKYIHFIENGVPVFNFGPTASLGVAQITSFPNGSNPTITINVGSSDGVNSSNFSNGSMVQFQIYESHSYSNNVPIAAGDFVYNVYNRWFILANVSIGSSTTTFTVTDLYGNNIDSTSWGTCGNYLQISSVYEIASPYAYTDLPLLKYAQSFDVVQLRHHLYPRYQLARNNNQSYSLTPNNAWPSQQGFAQNLGFTGGLAGNVNQYYKVTTYNETTQQESLPCPILNISAAYNQTLSSGNYYSNGTWPGGPSNVGVLLLTLPTVSGLDVGQNIYVTKVIQGYGSSGGSGLPLCEPGTPYQIQYINSGSNQITLQVYNDFYINHPGYPNGTPNVYTITASAGNIISAVSQTNPILLTIPNTNIFSNGQEVQVLGTGIVGLDNLNFNVTIVNSTQISLNGVNGANYDFSTLDLSVSSLVSATAITCTNVTPTLASPINVVGSILGSIPNTQNIVFLVYSSSALNSGYGFIGTVVPQNLSTNFSFQDKGIPPDPTLSPIQYIPLFLGTGNYPCGCAYYQQRLVEFGSDNNPQGLWASVIGDYNNFTIHDPIQDDDAIILDIASNELGQIFDATECGFLILITDVGPMVVAGDQTGTFTPSSNLIKRQMFAGGAQQPRPLSILKNAIYLEANQGCMRDMEVLVTPYYTYIDKSEDVSVYSEHLLTDSPIIIWDYKQYPDSQIYSVREDGKIVLTTYFKEQEIQAFSWLDTLGTWLDVNGIQEGNETAIYVGAQRTTGPWIERFHTRYYEDSTADAIFTHATASYDGRVNGFTAVLSGGTAAQSTVTATFSEDFYGGFSIGNQVNFKVKFSVKGSTGYVTWYYCVARMQITNITSNTIVGTLFEAINPLMLGQTISDIRICSNVVGGLWHLEGQNVSVVCDGFVHANPNDNSSPVVTVTNGCVVLPRAYGVINVGLPYLSDMQTLDIDEAKSETFMDKKIAIKKVTLKLLDTGDIFTGPNFTECLKPGTYMSRPKLREEEGYDQTTGLFTGIIPVDVDAVYGYGGSFALRSSSPLPMTVLSVAPLTEIQTG